MAPYDDWTKTEELEDNEELLDESAYETRRDVILFCIDCSESMTAPRTDAQHSGGSTCHVLTAFEAAIQVMKRKALVGPNDSVGVILYNVGKHNDAGVGKTLKSGIYVLQPIAQVSAERIQDLMHIVEDTRENSNYLREEYLPMSTKMPMGDLFTSCNWVMRDGAPKSATKRVFLVTNDDNPNSGPGRDRFVIAARTTLDDLRQSGIAVEPFFIDSEEARFDRNKFWIDVLLPTQLQDDGAEDDILPESLSIARIEDLLEEMRVYEVPKRAMFNLPLKLGDGLTIGVKGYTLVTKAKAGGYKYFADLGDSLEPTESRTSYVDGTTKLEVDKTKIQFGMTLGASGEDQDVKEHGFGARSAARGSRVFYTKEEAKSFRTLGFSPGIRLLGFKDLSELAFEDNVKHSIFIHPDETTYSGSKRTFSALIKSMIKKKKIGIAVALLRSNSSPAHFALLPQAEKFDGTTWTEPAGIHLIPFPFADDIREAPIDKAAKAESKELISSLRAVVKKMELKSQQYLPDSYPNPALAFHNAQLEAQAFHDEFNAESFVDLTKPNHAYIQKKVGSLIQEFNQLLRSTPTADVVIETTAGAKRKADVSVSEAEIRSSFESGRLNKLRADQLKEFLKSKSLSASGKKADLMDRVAAWLEKHA